MPRSLTCTNERASEQASALTTRLTIATGWQERQAATAAAQLGQAPMHVSLANVVLASVSALAPPPFPSSTTTPTPTLLRPFLSLTFNARVLLDPKKSCSVLVMRARLSGWSLCSKNHVKTRSDRTVEGSRRLLTDASETSSVFCFIPLVCAPILARQAVFQCCSESLVRELRFI